MFFGKKTKESSSGFAKLHHKSVRYISIKDSETYSERIIGKEGTINVADGELVIVCQNEVVYRHSLDALQMAEFMSHDGFTLRDLQDPEADTINVYYTK